MTSFNLLADSVSIIKNGQNSFMREVRVPFSNLILNFLNVLTEEGYVGDVQVQELRKGVRFIFVKLKYYRGQPLIVSINVISKPSRRVYWSVDKFKEFYNGLGMFVLSTSRGILPVYKASKINVGGEVLCSIF